MVAVLVHIHRGVVRLHVWLVGARGEVHSDVEEVNCFHICLHRDVQSVLFETKCDMADFGDIDFLQLNSDQQAALTCPGNRVIAGPFGSGKSIVAYLAIQNFLQMKPNAITNERTSSSKRLGDETAIG